MRDTKKSNFVCFFYSAHQFHDFDDDRAHARYVHHGESVSDGRCSADGVSRGPVRLMLRNTTTLRNVTKPSTKLRDIEAKKKKIQSQVI